MIARPDPPSSSDSPEDLANHVSQHPADWLLYLRNINSYASILEEEVESLRSTVTNHETAIASLRTTISEQEGVIKYQVNRYNEDTEKKTQEIIKLEVEKLHLLNAAVPAIITPPAELKVSTETPADVTPRTNMLTPVSRSESSHLSERIPDPKEFDGTRSDLRRFTQQIYGKMKTNADRFPTATTRLAYVAGRLTGKAYELILPRTVYGIPQFVDYPEMLQYLEDAFGDPDRVQNAQNKLYQLKQKNLDFSVYYAEFQRLALEGEMPEEALVPLLFQGISRELQDMLLHNPPKSRQYKTYAGHLQELDNRYRQHQQQISRTKVSALPRSPTSYAAAASARPAPVSSSLPRRISSPRPEWKNRRGTLPHAPEGDPMDLSLLQRPPNGRRERGECFRCGSKDHRVAGCPEPDTRPRSQIRAMRPYEPSSPASSRSASPQTSAPRSLNGSSLS